VSADFVEKLIERALYADRMASREEWNKSHPDGKTAPYVSDADKCPRQSWYSLTNTPESDPPDANSLMNFALGHAAEEAVAEILERYGVPMIRERRIEIPWKGMVITGRPDFLFPIPGAGFLAELKTTTTRQAFMLEKEQGMLAHRHQILQYLHAGNLGLLEPEITALDCKVGALVYIVKDAQKFRNPKVVHAYDVHYDEAEVERVLDTFASMQLRAKSDPINPPARPEGYKPKGFPCAWCSYATTCWKGPQ